MKPHFFSHDYDARRNAKLLRVRKDMGMEGIGIYWCLIELLYERDNAIPVGDVDAIAFEFGVEDNKLLQLISNYDLFEVSDEVFSSPGIKKRLDERAEISDKRRKSVAQRKDRQQDDTFVQQNSTIVDVCSTKSLKDKDNTNVLSKGKDIPPLSPTGGKERQKKFDFEIEKLPEWINPDLAPAFKCWIDYKRGRGQGYASERTAKVCYANLANLSDGSAARAAEIVNFSVGNNYAGLFPPEGRTAPATNNMILKPQGGGPRW